MARELTVYGLVQGVGFRPMVKKTAIECGVAGTVKNTGGIVIICIDGKKEALDEFVQRLFVLPIGAGIERIDSREIEENFEGFHIIESDNCSYKSLPFIPADIATCSECEEELLNSGNRRYLHPFISCAVCGPRYSIIDRIPYDRENTVMSEFELCEECNNEYNDVQDRRSYAQTIACQNCGPELFFNGQSDNAIENSVEALKKGRIVAGKDIGGYHLVCDALNDKAVKTLRKIKNREEKPFAVMWNNIEQIKKYSEVNNIEETLLSSPKRPIVLVKKKKDLAKSVCIRSSEIGAMLPCNPVQILLTRKISPLVMTSGNISGEPIVIDDDVMIELSEKYDFDVLSHNRKVLIPLDDSIVRVICGKTQIIRRGRGYTPEPVVIAGSVSDVFAAGGDLKNSFCIARDNQVIMSQYLGDLEEMSNYKNYIKNIEHVCRLFNFKNKKTVCDLHPAYYSTQFAVKKENCIQVQHHMAHMASVVAEHHIEGDFTAFVFDGTGYGTDNNIWGSEIFTCRDKAIKRAGHLEYVEAAGGNEAARDGKLLLNSYLYHVGLPSDEMDYKLIEKAIQMKINTVKTSSMGRLFDAISAMLGICEYNHYEGQSAVELEECARRAKEIYSLKLVNNNGIIGFKNLFLQVQEALDGGVDIPSIAAGFHQAIVDVVIETAENEGCKQIILSGGVFMNRILTEKCYNELTNLGYIVYINEKVPCNDGGIALGQVYIAESGWNICV